MDRDHTLRMQAVIEKIGVFRGLTTSEAQRLLKLCRSQSYEADQTIYRVGEPSGEMLILLQGRSVAVSGSGTVLGEILPGTATGEMGVFSGRARSATIVASEKSTGLVIPRLGLDALLTTDAGICKKVLMNVVNLLCERLEHANISIEVYAGKSQHRPEEETSIEPLE